MIKNVFLDLDDTIFDFQKGERHSICKTFEQMGIPTDEAVISRYIEINLDCWRALERGEMTKEQVLVGRFEVLFNELNIPASAPMAQRIYEDFLALEYDFIPGAVELLESFRSTGKYNLYTATNGIPEVQKPRIAKSGIAKYFNVIFISEEIGYAKPDKRFFDACFSSIDGFNLAETIIVGDSLTSDIKGGRDAGIKTCLFNPKGKPNKTDIIPDFEISSLGELPHVLMGL